MAHTQKHWSDDDWTEWDAAHELPQLPPTGAGITEPPWSDTAAAGPSARDAAEAAAGGEVWSHKRCTTCGYYPPCQCPGNPFGT